ncbi:hypothetical protein QW180_30220 [Vibrio sinaloensis]|nr:hypothetical protein [Vibrio sinaloensis]
MLSKACDFIRQYQATHNTSVRVNVNVSVLQLLNHSFPETVKSIADQYLIEPKHIVFRADRNHDLRRQPERDRSTEQIEPTWLSAFTR